MAKKSVDKILKPNLSEQSLKKCALKKMDKKSEILAQMGENPAFLKEQILTYLGNKRALLSFIQKGVNQAKSDLGRDKISCADLFSGSGVVARFLKQHANFLIANDLELYSHVINECYLSNISAKLKAQLLKTHQNLINLIDKSLKDPLKSGFITELYAPSDENEIKAGERAFYTRENARYIDIARELIKNVPNEMQKFFIAPLLYESSNRANTSGVFKGFYKNKQGIGQFGGEGKNALGRIMGKIALSMPVFSNFSVPYEVYRRDANELARELDRMDLIYLDPPYNQHPYSSNYFMLNLIASYERPREISRVSGIAKGWNRSVYNKKAHAANAFFELISALRAKFILISYNCEGFISKDEFKKNLAKFGKVDILEQEYNAFRGSRNLNARNLHVKESLYILKKA